MVVTCEIQFDHNPDGTFFSGQLVNGTVQLTADKPKDVKGVLLKISGYAVTKWMERRFGYSRQFLGREDYVESNTYLMGSEHNIRTAINPGTHTYAFSCLLPQLCPSSFEGRHGCIRYSIKVLLQRPWKFDQVYSRGFTVLKLLDLNYEPPQLKIPCNSENYKIYCCAPCKTEPLKLQLRLPQAGYVPGQRIPAEALVINNTNITVAEVKFSLVMLVRYFSQYPPEQARVERIVMTEVLGESVLRNSTRSICKDLHIPATPPSCVHSCSIMKIVYQVEVETKMKGCFHSNQKIAIPITIGNVPYWSTGVIQQQPQSNRGLPNEVITNEFQNENEIKVTSAAPITPTDIYVDLPPPSYKESVHTVRGDINEDEIHAFGPCEFAPLYPVYSVPILTETMVSMDSGDGQKGGYINENFVNEVEIR